MAILWRRMLKCKLAEDLEVVGIASVFLAAELLWL